jgi:hypothetical protein
VAPGSADAAKINNILHRVADKTGLKDMTASSLVPRTLVFYAEPDVQNFRTDLGARFYEGDLLVDVNAGIGPPNPEKYVQVRDSVAPALSAAYGPRFSTPPMSAFVPIFTPPEEMKEAVVFGVKLRYPDGGKIRTEQPSEDFFLFEFTYGGHVVLNGYIGDFPSPSKTLDRNEVIGGVAVKMTRSTANGTLSKVVLFDRGEGSKSGLPRYIHFWYDNLSPADAGIANKIIVETLAVNKQGG